MIFRVFCWLFNLDIIIIIIIKKRPVVSFDKHDYTLNMIIIKFSIEQRRKQLELCLRKKRKNFDKGFAARFAIMQMNSIRSKDVCFFIALEKSNFFFGSAYLSDIF